MAYSYTCLTLQRVVIPVVLGLAALFRPVGISFVYLLMFFISPFIPIATTRNFRRSVTPYLIILLALSTILLLCHGAVQGLLLTLYKEHPTGSCEFTEQLLRHVGFIDYRNLDIVEVVKWLVPEVLVFLTSLTVYLVTKKLTTIPPPATQMENGQHLPLQSPQADATQHHEASATRDPASASRAPSIVDLITEQESPNFDRLITISPVFCLMALFFAGILRPSVPGGFYFLFFLISGSYWATFQSLQRGFALLLRCVMVVLVIDILCVVSYQTPWMQEHIDSKTLLARLLSLEPLITSTCANDIRILMYNMNYKVDSFLSPIAVLISYYTLALSTMSLVHPRIVTKPTTAFGQQLENGSNNKCNHHQLPPLTTPAASRGSKREARSKAPRLNVSIRREQQRSIATEATETTPLVRTTNRKSTVFRRDSLKGVRPSNISDIGMDVLDLDAAAEEEVTASIFEQIYYGIVSVGGFIYQNSYIFTNILMMAWSIVYHSWLTFALLLWANLLWMIPNQRKAMMRSSPFIVIYAELLLVAQYIYGMDLNNDEIPDKVDTTGINLAQIGFVRPQAQGIQPCLPLLVKTSFLLMFWVTLRQFFKEKNGVGLGSPDMMGPIQFSRGGADTSHHNHGDKKTSKFLKKVGGIIKSLLVRLWIWLLVLVIFLCAITGDHMNGFRICYMALFLFFLLVFQSSKKAWLSLMYGFWIFLIFYAMSILIMIYTYQFDNFDYYWTTYLNISKTLQSDMGLERFKTKELFLHLLSPTMIVILTVIQVHYFHKRFIESLINQRVTPLKASQRHRSSISPSSIKFATEQADFEQSLKDLFRLFFRKLKNQSKRLFKNFKGVFYRFFELHLIKLVYIAAFVCSIQEVCVIHVVLVFLCIFGLICRANFQVFISRVISFVVTIIILMKMIYQIAYLDHSQHDVNCQNITASHGTNTAAWYGLQKASEETGGLIGLLRKYIVYMVIVTLHAVVMLRQYQMRSNLGTEFSPLPKVLFPNITRQDAEKNLEGMVKYLFNYGFYKFGFEISLITLVATVTFRRDVISVVYVFWLLVLLWFDRWNCRRIWSIFQMFIAVTIILQYLLFVGLPPSLCIQYPWETIDYSDSIQIWALLPGALQINHVSKLMFDFMLLLVVNGQKRVYNIESRYENTDSYAGGTNKSVVKDIAKLGQERFQNPTRDFLSNIRNYLDVFKNGILCGFYWITLAVVFLAGTNITDLLAIGYLIGAFIFLWQGSDFYLHHINVILRRWNGLIAYNVANIVIKTCLQMAGCMFLNVLTQKCCWLVHIFGIHCAGKVLPSEMTSEEGIFLQNECPPITAPLVLVWDTVCFAFLIFQLRIFKSHYFCHIISDTQANSILASRGAELIEDLRQKQIEHRQEHEKSVLFKIKRKMEIIRATQQKMMRPLEKPTHFDDLDKDTEEVKRKAPLVQRNNSCISCHSAVGDPTNHDDESSSCSTNAVGGSESYDQGQEKLLESSDNEVIMVEFEADEAVETGLFNEPGKRLRIGQDKLVDTFCNNEVDQSNSLSSDVLTMPLDSFLDGNRSSLYSVPNSDLMQALQADSEESFPVFSPPPYDTSAEPHIQRLLPPDACGLNSQLSRDSSVVSTSFNNSDRRRHQRQSSVNAVVSWNETVSVKCTSKECNIEEICQEVPVTLRKKSLYRRHLSMGNASYSLDESSTSQRERRRRYSNISGTRDEYYRRASARPNSWGPVGNAYYLDSLMSEPTPSLLHSQYPSPLLSWFNNDHCYISTVTAVRAGDYYMFEDMDEKFELDLIEDDVDFLDDKITEDEKKMTRRKTVIEVVDKVKLPEKAKQPTTSSISAFLRQPHMEVRKDDAESEDTVKHSTGYDKDESSDEEIKENPIIRLLEGFLVSLTIRLNRFSRNYRYVNKILTEEKNVLKESRNFMRISRSVTKAFLMPIVSLQTEDASSSSASFTSANSPNANGVENATNIQTHHTTAQNINSNTSNTISTTNSPPKTQLPLEPPPQPHDPQDPQHVIDIIESPLDTVDAIDSSKDEIEIGPANKRRKNSEGVPEIRVMVPSLNSSFGGGGTAPMSKQCSHEKVDSAADFDLEDDFTTRDHHILIEVLISSWYAILSNTDLICYIVVFINQVVNASIISLPLPIMVFLWGTLSLPRPTKTFWVTLIAYTQAIVLIKCIFQFKLIWANYNNLPNTPLAPEKIIGVELNANYASYDLLLLLVLFLHRFILKSQGLWKSKYRDEMMDEVFMKKYTSPENDENDSDSQSDDNIVMVPPQQMIAEGETTPKSQVSTEKDAYIRGMSQLKHSKYFSSLRKFFFNLRKKIRLPTDVYALMFMCDFINFFVLLFGFTAFGSQQIEGDGGVQTYLAENKVPIPFLIMLLVQFMLLVIDRALYLRKSLFYKIIFHFLSVIGIHIWMFFLVPAVTERRFNSLAPPIIFYMIKCCYLLFSSYQIKCGYPKRILGNFLTRSFSLVNMISFKVYMIIPFLYELRTILDWVCTDTTMTLFDWLKMEDIFADIYFIKCSRQMETDFPAVRAQKKWFYTKLIMGGTVILLIVICIWGPLGLFALGNAVGQPNVPYEVSTSIRIGPYDPIYETHNRESIFIFDNTMYAKMQSAYMKQKGAITFISNYDESDIAAISLAGNSPSLWSISPPDKERLLQDLTQGAPLIARFTYSLTRVPPAKGLIGTVFSEVTFTINSTFPGRESMINMLSGASDEEEEVVLPNMLPKFIKVLNSGEMTTVTALMPQNQVYRPLVIRMKSDATTKDIWWEIREFCKDNFHTNTLSKLPFSTCDSGIVMYTFNDKKFPSTFSFLTAGGIIGLYTTFVLLASRVLKSFIAGQNRRIMFEDLPYVDRVLQLCLDIYLVREALEFALEEDLFAKLIFLYRSPETMIKWTRPKEEIQDDETDTESVLSRTRRQEQL